MIVFFRIIRPAQWTKNFVIFAALIFSLNFFDQILLYKALIAFGVFCLLSSAIYVINDIWDAEKDRKHPQKKFRPIASGHISLPQASILALILLLIAIPVAILLDPAFSLVALAYVLLMFLYTFLIKEMVILDIFAIAAGFVLRAVAGVVVIGVSLSPWLIICTILLSLLIGFGKRRHELLTLGEESDHRRNLRDYSPQLLDQLISAVVGSIIIAYALYCLWPETVAKFGTKNLFYTIPFVIYGIFRYLYLIYKKDEGGRPEKILLTDIPLIIDILLWLAALAVIIYWVKV